MPAKELAVTTIAKEMADTLRVNVMERGYSSTTIASDMQRLGHKGWNSGVVIAIMSKGRAITIDEYAGLTAVFKARATLLQKEIDRMAALLVREAEAGRNHR